MAYLEQKEEPLFRDFIWSEPERSSQQPQILILGGHQNSLQAPLKSFQYFQNMKIPVDVILPDVWKKDFKNSKKTDSNLIFATSTPAGSFSQKSYSYIINILKQYKCLLIVGDLSANHETELLIKQLLQDYEGQKIIMGKFIAQILKDKKLIFEPLNLLLDKEQIDLLSAYKSEMTYNDNLSNQAFAQFLESLELPHYLIINHQQSLWTKVDKNICQTYLDDKLIDSFYPLTAQMAHYLSRSHEVWRALTSACWQFKAHSNSTKIGK